VKTYWTEGLFEDAPCEWCGRISMDYLYKTGDDFVCEKCLKTTEVCEDESLTLEERNK